MICAEVQYLTLFLFIFGRADFKDICIARTIDFWRAIFFQVTFVICAVRKVPYNRFSVRLSDRPSVRPTKNWFFLQRVIHGERSERRREREREKHANFLRGETSLGP